MLEQFAADITDTLKLPYDIPIKGSQCGEAQLYWSSSDKDVVLCYEDIPRLLDQARNSVTQTPRLPPSTTCCWASIASPGT